MVEGQKFLTLYIAIIVAFTYLVHNNHVYTYSHYTGYMDQKFLILQVWTMRSSHKLYL